MEFLAKLFVIALGWGFLALMAHALSRRFTGAPLTWWRPGNDDNKGSTRATFGQFALGAVSCLPFFVFQGSMDSIET
ncbi:MAG: hypothetical protein HY856_06315 [Burkholderiales bacterium]|nr:hypothetical protein [Burkholderiales bacterium]